MLNKFVSIGDSFSKHMGYEAFVGSSGIVIESRESYSRIQILNHSESSMMFTEVDIHNHDIIHESSPDTHYHALILYQDPRYDVHKMHDPYKAAFYISTNEDMLTDFRSHLNEHYSHLKLITHRLTKVYTHQEIYSNDMFLFIKETAYDFYRFLKSNPDIKCIQDLPVIHLDDSTTNLAAHFFKDHGPYTHIQYNQMNTVSD